MSGAILLLDYRCQSPWVLVSTRRTLIKIAGMQPSTLRAVGILSQLLNSPSLAMDLLHAILRSILAITVAVSTTHLGTNIVVQGSDTITPTQFLFGTYPRLSHLPITGSESPSTNWATVMALIITRIHFAFGTPEDSCTPRQRRK